MIRFSLYKLTILIFLLVVFFYVVRWQIAVHNGNEAHLQRFLHICNVTDAYRAELEQLFEKLVTSLNY